MGLEATDLSFFAYILASGPYGTLYTGSTDNLAGRVYAHRLKVRPGFTAKYDVTKLVWFQTFGTREGAFRRERQIKEIKEWRRKWKTELIETENPRWADLYDQLNNLLIFR